MPRSELSEKFVPRRALETVFFSCVRPRSTHIHHARHIVFNRSLCPLSLALCRSLAPAAARERTAICARARRQDRAAALSLPQTHHTHINMHSAAALLTRTMRHHKYYYSVKYRGEALLKKKKKKKDRRRRSCLPFIAKLLLRVRWRSRCACQRCYQAGRPLEEPPRQGRRRCRCGRARARPPGSAHLRGCRHRARGWRRRGRSHGGHRLLAAWASRGARRSRRARRRR